MRRLEESTEIESPPEVVWQTLRDFGDVAKWAPRIVRSRPTSGHAEGVGVRRVFRHLWGFQLEEVVTAWDEGRGYSFDVLGAPPPLKNVREAWTIDTVSTGARVSTTVEYEMGLGAIGHLIDWMLVRHLIRAEMRLGLAGLKQYVEPSRHPLIERE